MCNQAISIGKKNSLKVVRSGSGDLGGSPESVFRGELKGVEPLITQYGGTFMRWFYGGNTHRGHLGGESRTGRCEQKKRCDLKSDGETVSTVTLELTECIKRCGKGVAEVSGSFVTVGVRGDP